jgi:hypothetical protein
LSLSVRAKAFRCRSRRLPAAEAAWWTPPR